MCFEFKIHLFPCCSMTHEKLGLGRLDLVFFSVVIVVAYMFSLSYSIHHWLYCYFCLPIQHVRDSIGHSVEIDNIVFVYSFPIFTFKKLSFLWNRNNFSEILMTMQIFRSTLDPLFHLKIKYYRAWEIEQWLKEI